MKRTEYSFGKIDFNGSRAVIPTERRLRIKRFLVFFLFVIKECPIFLYSLIEVVTIKKLRYAYKKLFP